MNVVFTHAHIDINSLARTVQLIFLIMVRSASLHMYTFHTGHCVFFDKWKTRMGNSDTWLGLSLLYTRCWGYFYNRKLNKK